MRIFLGNGRGKGGGQGRGGDERPPSGTRKTGGRWNPKVPKRQAIGDSHPDGKGPPTGRSWDIHPQPSKRNIPRPTAPHTIGRVSSTASEEMLRSRRNEGPEIGRGMRRCTHRSTSRDVGGDDTPGSVGLTPSWNNHPFHSMDPSMVEEDVATSYAPSPSKTKRHVRMRRRGTTCACNETFSVPTQARGTDSMRIGKPIRMVEWCLPRPTTTKRPGRNKHVSFQTNER